MINHEYAPVDPRTLAATYLAMEWAEANGETHARQVEIIASRVQHELENQGWKPKESHLAELEKLKDDKDRWHSAWASRGTQMDAQLLKVQQVFQKLYDAGSPSLPRIVVVALAKEAGVLVIGEDGIPVFGEE